MCDESPSPCASLSLIYCKGLTHVENGGSAKKEQPVGTGFHGLSKKKARLEQDSPYCDECRGGTKLFAKREVDQDCSSYNPEQTLDAEGIQGQRQKELPNPVKERIKRGRVIDTRTDGIPKLTKVVMMNAIPRIHFIDPRNFVRKKVDCANCECRSQKNQEKDYGSIYAHCLVYFPVVKLEIEVPCLCRGEMTLGNLFCD